MGARCLQLCRSPRPDLFLQGQPGSLAQQNPGWPTATEIFRSWHGPASLDRSLRELPHFSRKNSRAISGNERRIQVHRHRCQPINRRPAESRPRIAFRPNRSWKIQRQRRLQRQTLLTTEKQMETGTSGGIAAKRQAKRILVPRPSQRRFYGYGIPGVDVNKLAGKLIVVEGADGSGRSTQIAKL